MNGPRGANERHRTDTTTMRTVNRDGAPHDAALEAASLEATARELAALDLAASVSPLARQVIGAVRTRYNAVTSNARVALLGAKGLCAQAERDPEAWFSDRSRGGQSRARDRSEATRLCHGCPVLRECLEYAVASGQSYGVWGGMSERDRAVLSRAALSPTRRTTSTTAARPGQDTTRISA